MATLDSGGLSQNAQLYKREFWSTENLKFSEPWYRLDKSAKLLTRLAGGRERTVLDVGCGPATLMRMLPANIRYFGIDIAIHEPAPNVIEADIVESRIDFDGRRFDFVIAQGLFEYLGAAQSQKLSEIAAILTDDGTFILTYTNFGHRKTQIYSAFSNVQPLATFRRALSEHFTIDQSFPASHNWKHGQPARKLVRAANMLVSFNIPLISRVLAVEYFFICSPRPSGAAAPPAR
jgi:SAM-dependent methyltransferase